MKKRPISITVIGWIFISVGCVGLVRGLLPLVDAAASRSAAGIGAHDIVDVVLVSASGLLAVLGGVYTLRGSKWARWLLVVWMCFHIILSIWHTPLELLVHSVLFAPILYFLLRPRAAAYFRGARAEPL